MRSSPTTDAGTCAGATGQSRGDAPRPSPESAVRPATTCPTDGGVDANPISRCVASYVPVCAVCGAVPLTVSGNVPARPSAVRQHQRIAHSATRTSCRGRDGVRRRARSVQCCVRDVAWRHGAQAEGGARAMPAAAPPPPPRRTRRACCDVVLLGEACPCADSGRFGVWPSALLWAAQRYPS